MIQIDGLEFSYPGSATPAVDGLSLSIRDGVLFGLLGPNGSGKTTLISLIVGLLKPSAGRLMLGMGTGGDAAPHVAYVPQEYAFYPQLSVNENLRFFAGVSSVPARQRAARIDAAVEATALGDVRRTRAGRLSGGLKRRLNLALGLVNEPDLLLLDEPTVGIDPHSRHFILESIRSIHRTGTTVVYTSHYMEEVEALCQEIGILDHGRLIARGSLHELLGRDGSGLLSVTLHDAADAQWLESVPNAAIIEGNLRVARCPSPSVPEILSALNAQGVHYSQVRYAQRNLEDLFLHLTGRQLRE